MNAGGGLDAVMLIGFGGPTAPGEIRPFLDELLRGRSVPRERYEEVVRHYEAIGGRSPYNDNTACQAEAVGKALTRAGVRMPVRAAMRNWKPYVADVMREMTAGGARRIFGFILAAHRSEASWERYQDTVRDARAALGPDAPEVIYPDRWHTHPGFVEAVRDRTEAALAQLDSVARRDARIIFTAHSVPIAMDAQSGYAAQVRESAGLVAAALRRESWILSFQSRSGSPREPWLEPDIAAVLREQAGNTVVVVPIGFLCDHVEVLYDLDIQAQAIAREAGVTMKRAGSVGAHPAFVRMVAGMVSEMLARG